MEKNLDDLTEGLSRRAILKAGLLAGGILLTNPLSLFGNDDSAEEKDSLDLRIEKVSQYKMPFQRKDHGAVIVRNNLYVVGGSDEKSNPVPNVLVAQLKDNLEFAETSSLPKEATFTGAVTNGTHVYVFSPQLKKVFFTSIKEDGKLSEWKESPYNLPTNATSTFVTDSKRLYVIGGQDSNSGSKGYHDEVWVSEIDSNGNPSSWTDKTPRLQIRRSGHGAVSLNEKLYVVGGWQYHSPFELNDVQVAEIKDKELKEFRKVKLPSPKVRIHSVTAQKINDQDYLFSFGGATGEDSKATNELRYALVKPNGATESWTSLPTELNPVYESATAWNENDLYVVGGWNGKTTYNSVTKLKVTPKKSKLF